MPNDSSGVLPDAVRVGVHPFTTLYRLFIDTRGDGLSHNPRTPQQVRGLDRLGGLDALRGPAARLLVELDTSAL